MKKVYKSLFSGINILVKVRGEIRHVDFNRDVINQYGVRGCSFTTDDEELQRALEAHKDFKSGKRNQFWTDEPFATTKAVDEPKEEDVQSENKDTECNVFGCKTVKEASAILESEPYCFEHNKVNSRVKILAVAKELNLSFPNL